MKTRLIYKLENKINRLREKNSNLKSKLKKYKENVSETVQKLELSKQQLSEASDNTIKVKI